MVNLCVKPINICMPLFTKDKQTILFKHIPKTAGSSVETAFEKSGWKMSLWQRTYKAPPCCAQHWHHDICVKNDVYKQNINYEFTIVRNPYTRLFSEYFHAHKGAPVPKEFNDAFMQKAEKFFISDLQSHLKNNHRYHRDNHYRSQHQFVGPDTEVFKFENLEQMWQILKEKYQLINLPHQRARGNNCYPLHYHKHSDKFKSLYTKLYAVDHEKFNYPIPF